MKPLGPVPLVAELNGNESDAENWRGSEDDTDEFYSCSESNSLSRGLSVTSTTSELDKSLSNSGLIQQAGRILAKEATGKVKTLGCDTRLIHLPCPLTI